MNNLEWTSLTLITSLHLKNIFDLLERVFLHVQDFY